MTPLEVIALAADAIALANRLVAENRAATQAEQDALLVSVKKRQATEDTDWQNGSAPAPSPTA